MAFHRKICGQRIRVLEVTVYLITYESHKIINRGPSLFQIWEDKWCKYSLLSLHNNAKNVRNADVMLQCSIKSIFSYKSVVCSVIYTSAKYNVFTLFQQSATYFWSYTCHWQTVNIHSLMLRMSDTKHHSPYTYLCHVQALL